MVLSHLIFHKARRFPQYQPAQTQNLSLLKRPKKVLQFAFDQMTSHLQSAFLYHRALHHLSSKDIIAYDFFSSVCSFFHTHEILYVLFPFHDTSWKLALAYPSCLFLTAHKQPFHTPTFGKPADLTNILHNNYHISRHHYNYSAESLLVYLDICDTCLLVNMIFQRLVQYVCHWYTWHGMLTASLHTLILSR